MVLRPLGVWSLPPYIEKWRSTLSPLIPFDTIPHPWPSRPNNRLCQLRQIQFYKIDKAGIIFNTVYSKMTSRKGPSSAHLAVMCEHGRMVLDLVMMTDAGIASLDNSPRLLSRDASLSTGTSGLVLQLDRDRTLLQAGTSTTPPRHVALARFALPSDKYHTSIYMTEAEAMPEMCIILEPKAPQLHSEDALVWRLQLSVEGNTCISTAAHAWSFLIEYFERTSIATLTFVNLCRPQVPAPFGITSVVARMVIDQIDAFHEHQKGAYSEIIQEDGTSVLALCVPKPGEPHDMFFEFDSRTGQVAWRRVQTQSLELSNQDRPRADSGVAFETELLLPSKDKNRDKLAQLVRALGIISGTLHLQDAEEEV